jgi:hypothetical protein
MREPSSGSTAHAGSAAPASPTRAAPLHLSASGEARLASRWPMRNVTRPPASAERRGTVGHARPANLIAVRGGRPFSVLPERRP